MKIFSGIILAAALVGTPALAADMPLKAPPAPAPINWNGFYVGGNLGAAISHASGTSDFLDPTANPLFDRPTNPHDNSFSDTGFIGGVQLGYNWQVSPRWVAGLEGDWDFTNTSYGFCRQTSRNGSCDTVALDGTETINSNTQWLATLRARLGVTFGNFLLYGTGGAALGSVKTDVTLACATGCGSSFLPQVVNQTSSQTDTKFGWVAGLGAEMAIDNHWSAKVEWLHIDLGKVDSSLTVNGNNGAPSTETAVWSRNERYDVIRVGFNYRFGGNL